MLTRRPRATIDLLDRLAVQMLFHVRIRQRQRLKVVLRDIGRNRQPRAQLPLTWTGTTISSAFATSSS